MDVYLKVFVISKWVIFFFIAVIAKKSEDNNLNCPLATSRFDGRPMSSPISNPQEPSVWCPGESWCQPEVRERGYGEGTDVNPKRIEPYFFSYFNGISLFQSFGACYRSIVADPHFW